MVRGTVIREILRVGKIVAPLVKQLGKAALKKVTGWAAGFYKASGAFIKGFYRRFVDAVWKKVMKKTPEKIGEKVEEWKEKMEKLWEEWEKKKEEEERKKQVEEEEKREEEDEEDKWRKLDEQMERMCDSGIPFA